MTPAASILFTSHHLIGGKNQDWHTTNPTPGYINGLPLSHGMKVALSSTGLCLIITSANIPYIGHNDWFIADRNPFEGQRTREQKTTQPGEFDITNFPIE